MWKCIVEMTLHKKIQQQQDQRMFMYAHSSPEFECIYSKLIYKANAPDQTTRAAVRSRTLHVFVCIR